MTTTFSIRLDKELLETIKEIADKETRTANQQIVHLLEKGIARYEAEQRAIDSLDEADLLKKKKSAG